MHRVHYLKRTFNYGQDSLLKKNIQLYRFRDRKREREKEGKKETDTEKINSKRNGDLDLDRGINS